MGTYRAWYLSLAAFLLVPGQVRAQDKEAPPLKMVYAVWKDQGGAANTMKQMNKKTYDLVEAYAVLVKDTAGKVAVRQRHNKAGGSVTALQGSQVVDTAIARLSAPAPSAADSASGHAPSGQASRLSEEDLKKVVGMFGPGESAVIIMSPIPALSDIKHYLGVGGVAEIVELEIKE
jgi:hypothetical protein